MTAAGGGGTVDRELAESLALAYMTARWHVGDEPVVVRGATLESASAWMVFVQSRGYVETGEVGAMVVGHGGLIVDKNNGSIEVTGSAEPPQNYLDRYERGRSRHGQPWRRERKQ